MKIEIFPAKIGDCFLISYGNNYEKHILIDGGYKETYTKFLKKRLKEINKLNQKLELIIVTHIDQDHIGGILSLVEENGTKLENNIIKIEEIWHNSYKHLQDDIRKKVIITPKELKVLEEIISEGISLEAESGDISSYQGSMLASYIYENNYKWNTQFEGKAISVDFSKKITIDDELKIILLSPSNKELEELKREWEKELKKRILNFQLGEGKIFNDAFEFFLIRRDEEEEEGYTCSNNNGKWSELDFPKEDKSKTNGSSIAVILETKNKKVLFLGDSKPSIIIENLKKLVEENNYSLKFDAVKISHHGSLKNTNKELLELIESENWIFTGDGNRNKPSEKLVKYILETKKDKIKKLIFNYDIDWLKSLKEIQKEYNCEIKINLKEESKIFIL